MLRGLNDNSIDRKSIYTVVFNSLHGVKTNALTANEVTYSVDWSVIPDQKYKIHFSYMGEVNNLDGSVLAQVFADLGVPTNVIYAGSSANRTQAISSQYLGFCETYLLGANSFLHAEDGTNPPIQIDGRPRNNSPIIRVFNNANPAALFAPTSGNLGDYILTLKFIPVDSNS